MQPGSGGKRPRDLQRCFEKSYLAGQQLALAYELALPILRRELPRSRSTDSRQSRAQANCFRQKNLGGSRA